MLLAITGASGFVGRRLASRLARKFRLRLLTHSSSKNLPEARNPDKGLPAGAELFEGDITEASSLSGFCEGAHAVLHLASTFDFDFSKCCSINVLGTRNVLHEAKHAGVKKFIFFSTGVAYGARSSKRPSLETDQLQPDTFYGLSKALAEDVVNYYGQDSAMRTPARLANVPMRTLTLRLANVYGPGSERGVIHNYAKALASGAPLRLDGSGKQARDFVYVEDAVDAVERALAYSGKQRIFNISGGKKVTMLDLIRLMENVSGRKARINRVPSNDNFVQNLWMSNALAAKELKWKPRTSLEKGLAKTLTYFSIHAE